MTLNLIAPAKLNLAIEILSKRTDGYHELVSLMQTIDLTDLVRLDPAPGIELVVTGDRTANLPEDPARNLAYRAAELMRNEAKAPSLGVRIELDKGVPAGAGLGGGSSDAAAVIRGLNRLWGLDWPIARLEAVAAMLGSDVPFFLHGGAAFVSGRGEVVESIGDGADREFTLFVTDQDVEDKTRRMYSLISKDDWTNGRHVRRAADAVRRGAPMLAEDYFNPFARHIVVVAPAMDIARARCRKAGLHVVTTGAGPSFFAPIALTDIDPTLIHSLARDCGVTAIPTRGISSARTTAVVES